MNMLGNHSQNYEEIFEIDGTNTSTIYSGFNIIRNQKCCLKVINKKQLELGEYDFLLKQIKREEELIKLCKSKYIVNLNDSFETEENIIFELEYCEHNLSNYLLDKGELRNDPEKFKKIVISLANALKIINSKGVMHRDIKPHNIFYEEEKDDLSSIKLGDFGCSILIKDNTSDPIGTIFYSSPEIIQNLKYDEKCDLWSLGITLYELYFGHLPYGYKDKVTTNTIIECISDPKNFKFKMSNIPCIDYLFTNLLKVEPKERLSYEDFFKHVLNKDFMSNIDEIKKIIAIQIEEEGKYYIEEGFNGEKVFKEVVDKIYEFTQGNHFPDIMNFPNGSGENKFNNIIYYDENINFQKSINRDSDIFERSTPGAFILCSDELSLNMIKDEIIKEVPRDTRMTFNLITTGTLFKKVEEFLDKNKEFDKYINNICIYCLKLKNYLGLKNTHPKLHEDIYNKRSDIIKFIEKYSSEKIKPYPITKLITYDDYINKYKDRHFKISQFYGDLTPEKYQEYLNKMKDLIKEEAKSKELYRGQTILLKGFLSFKIEEDIDALDKLIIKEYTKNTFYGDLNKWLMNLKLNFYEPVAYFTSRLMFSLNTYAQNNNMYFKENKKKIYRGIKIHYSCLLQYKRAINKIIILSAFTSTSESEEFAKNHSGRKNSRELYENSLQFSVVYYITNIYKNQWISSGVNVQEETKFKKEKEILYQPFSFYYVKKVDINNEDKTANIYLETIGKNEILEEKIKLGKEIEYNKEKNIIQIKE